MKKEISILGVILLILAIVSISGCTTTAKTPQGDIYLDQITTPYQSGDGWSVNAWIASKAHKSYSNVTFIATGYTADNEVIGTSKVLVPTLNSEYQSTGCEVHFPNATKELDHITIHVTNATLSD
jgi:hypothetical protein